jgi:hypothetical protein
MTGLRNLKVLIFSSITFCKSALPRSSHGCPPMSVVARPITKEFLKAACYRLEAVGIDNFVQISSCTELSRLLGNPFIRFLGFLKPICDSSSGFLDPFKQYKRAREHQRFPVKLGLLFVYFHTSAKRLLNCLSFKAYKVKQTR